MSHPELGDTFLGEYRSVSSGREPGKCRYMPNKTGETAVNVINI